MRGGALGSFMRCCTVVSCTQDNEVPVGYFGTIRYSLIPLLIPEGNDWLAPVVTERFVARYMRCIVFVKDSARLLTYGSGWACFFIGEGSATARASRPVSSPD